MNKVTIKWHDLDDESSVNLENYTGFYVLVGENIEDEESDEVDLLDIRTAYKENILEKIDEPIDSYEFLEEYLEENPEMDIFFMMGQVQNSTVNPLTKELMEEVNCLLISANEPLFSDLCEEPGDNHGIALQVENTGDFHPLEETSELN
jgi:hypothetical protein